MARRALRLGMVGGGEGAFIGAVHRMAAALDGDWSLVAGAFSTDAGRNERTGMQLGLEPQRIYASFDAMIAAEQALPAEARITGTVRSFDPSVNTFVVDFVWHGGEAKGARERARRLSSGDRDALIAFLESL